MILTLFLIDLIFIKIIKFPIYSIFLVFVFYKKTSLIIPIIVSTILDIFMFKIYLSPLVVFLSLLALRKSKLNLIKSLTHISILYLGINFYLGKLSLLFLLKLLIIIGIYLLVLKLPIRE